MYYFVTKFTHPASEKLNVKVENYLYERMYGAYRNQLYFVKNLAIKIDDLLQKEGIKK